jgi:hypothetical protein
MTSADPDHLMIARVPVGRVPTIYAATGELLVVAALGFLVVLACIGVARRLVRA